MSGLGEHSQRRARGRASRVVVIAAAAGVALVAVLAIVNRDAIERWYEFRSTFAALGRNAQGYVQYRHRDTKIVFVAMPAGTFLLGAGEDERGAWDSERPRREVTLGAFLIAKYEVSQVEWRRVMDDDPSAFFGETLPVESVSWHDCATFCERTGFALPTEAQWERACRAGTETPFAFGESLDSTQANFNGTRPYGDSPASEFRERPVPCDALAPNDAGLHNMHGNVAEWCRDVYDEDFYERPEAARRDALSTSGSGHRVVRGGGWYSQAQHCRSAARSFEDPAHRGRSIGFRPVWERPR